MRIISGKFRSRQIHPPKDFAARPTTDFAKEGLFNIIDINFNIPDIRVLDIFSGTGSISYEFLSRGCTDIVALDISHRNAAFIKKNAQLLDPENKILKILQIDFFQFIKQHRFKEPFDIVFADPPYDLVGIPTIPDLVFDNGLVTPRGWLIVEHSARTDFSKHNRFFKVRNYSKVHFSFFGIEETNEQLKIENEQPVLPITESKG